MENLEEKNDNDENISQSIKSSPNYDQQIDEIELLKNIIPEKIKVLKEEPNFNLEIEFEGNNIDENMKKFILEIYLNYDYPEKSPKFDIYEINNNLSDNRKNIIKEKLQKYCEENIGFPVIYQLYEICIEFAEEEEKIDINVKNEKEKIIIPYKFNMLNKIKKIDDIPIDIILLKNNNILVITIDNKIKIYDNKFESLIFENLEEKSITPIIFCKYFPSSTSSSSSEKESDFLFLFNYEDVLIYEISYLFKKLISKKEYNMKINGNIIVKFIQTIYSTSDVIELPLYKNSFFFVNNEDKEDKEHKDYLLTKYNIIKEKKRIEINTDKEIIKNNSEKIFRKLYNINSQKFIIASYTLKMRDYVEGGYKIEGINKMLFVNSENFHIHKSYNIKISPLKNSIFNYKDDFIIVSYFDIIKEKENIINENSDSESEKEEIKEEDKRYNFEDNEYNKIFHYPPHESIDIYDDNYYYVKNDKYYYPDKKNINDYFNKYNNKYFSYDIGKHKIGIFNINTEELITIIEFDIIKNVLNINNNILCLFEKSKIKTKIEQIANERIYHHYFNIIPSQETNYADNYKRENYFGFLLLDDDFKVVEEHFDYSNITCINEVEKGYLAFGSINKGIILYQK